jgi:protein-tyrosine phosphatase
MKLCDLHSHVLPEVDDGAPTMEYALEMLQNAAASDVELLAVTPHCNLPYGDGNYRSSQLQERFFQLQQAASHIPVQLVLGAEVFADRQLPQLLQQGKLPTLNAGRYLLTEFPIDTPAREFLPLLQAILTHGYIPLVAHPERYMAVCQSPQITEEWLDMGCHIQLTGGSVLGEYGKTVGRTAAHLLQQDLVACIASDAHGLHRRSNFLLDVYDHLALRYSRQYANCLMYETPMAICHNADI